MKILLVALLFAIVCTPVVTNPQNKPAHDTGWTIKSVEINLKSPPKASADQLRKVRVAKRANFDRLEFEFSGKFVPISKVRYAKPPFYLGETEETVKIVGKRFLTIDFTPAYAHDLETMKATVKNREKTAGLISVKAIRRTYDHEGQVIYVLGLAAQKPFRVQALANPARLIVDVKH
jgi:hypothetical protein